jgi:hypothetical protein
LGINLLERKEWVRQTVHDLIRLHFGSDSEDDAEEMPLPNSRASSSSGDMLTSEMRLILPKAVLRGSGIIVQINDDLNFANDTGISCEYLSSFLI